MAHRVSWSPRALRDVQAVADYIASDSPAYATAVVKKIVSLTRGLAVFPNSGRMVPELQDASIRELLAYNYRIIYRVDEKEVVVVAVIHGKRNLG
jgi:toxin ParE1/3/4